VHDVVQPGLNPGSSRLGDNYLASSCKIFKLSISAMQGHCQMSGSVPVISQLYSYPRAIALALNHTNAPRGCGSLHVSVYVSKVHIEARSRCATGCTQSVHPMVVIRRAKFVKLALDTLRERFSHDQRGVFRSPRPKSMPITQVKWLFLSTQSLLGHKTQNTLSDVHSLCGCYSKMP
jgi:hypothetical protein